MKMDEGESTFTFMLGNSLEELMRDIDGNACTMCSGLDFYTRERLRNHVQNVHFKYRFLLDIEGQPGCVLPCRKNCFHRKSHDESNRSHFHCPFCCKKFGRSQSFKAHLTGQGKCKSPLGLLKPKVTYNPDNVTTTKLILAANLSRKRSLDETDVCEIKQEPSDLSVPREHQIDDKPPSKRPNLVQNQNVPSSISIVQSHGSPQLRNLRNRNQQTNNYRDEDTMKSCEVQAQILRVLEDLLEVEKQRLEIEKQKLQLSNLQATHQILNMHK